MNSSLQDNLPLRDFFLGIKLMYLSRQTKSHLINIIRFKGKLCKIINRLKLEIIIQTTCFFA